MSYVRYSSSPYYIAHPSIGYNHSRFLPISTRQNEVHHVSPTPAPAQPRSPRSLLRSRPQQSLPSERILCIRCHLFRYESYSKARTVLNCLRRYSQGRMVPSSHIEVHSHISPIAPLLSWTFRPSRCWRCVWCHILVPSIWLAPTVAKHYTTSRTSFDDTARYWTEIYAGAPPRPGAKPGQKPNLGGKGERAQVS